MTSTDSLRPDACLKEQSNYIATTGSEKETRPSKMAANGEAERGSAPTQLAGMAQHPGLPFVPSGNWLCGRWGPPRGLGFQAVADFPTTLLLILLVWLISSWR